MNLFEIVRSAGGGDGFKDLAKLYGLPEDEVRRAAEALMPAFATGVRQSTIDPAGLLAFLQQLATEDFLRAYADPSSILAGRQSGAERALRLLLGSMDAARAVAKQASAFTGLSEEQLAKLMASFAAMTLGGIAEQAQEANPMLDALLGQFRSKTGDKEKPKGPLDRLEEEQAERERAARGAAELQRMQRHMVEAGLAAFQAGTAAWQKAMGDMLDPKAASGKPSGEPGIQFSGRDLFGEMLDSGVRLSESYQREMEALVQQMRPDASRG